MVCRSSLPVRLQRRNPVELAPQRLSNVDGHIGPQRPADPIAVRVADNRMSVTFLSPKRFDHLVQPRAPCPFGTWTLGIRSATIRHKGNRIRA